MSSLPPFKVEQWMDKHESTCSHNIAETCSDSISLQQLEQYSRDAGIQLSILQKLADTRLTYGHIRGSPELRANVARLYPAAEPAIAAENVLITNGAIGANFLVLLSLIRPGDHVVCVHPTYQQLWEVPLALGATVDLYRLTPSRSWQFSIDDLRPLLRPTTRLVIINNPNNPTGSSMARTTLESLIGAVRDHAAAGCIILSDEVYRPLFHSLPEGEQAPPSILELGYENVIATGSMSKAWSLAGIRTGWIATPRRDLIEALAARRDYTTISVSMLDDAVAARALDAGVARRIHKRNLELAKGNRELMEKWVESMKGSVEWIKPVAGTTAFLKIKQTEDVEAFCEELQKETGVLVVPGTCFGWQGWVRVGYVGDTETLRRGLERVGEFIGKRGEAV
ncbi:hypothetical protein ACQY0O_001081 [Thecaphora frezii]